MDYLHKLDIRKVIAFIGNSDSHNLLSGIKLNKRNVKPYPLLPTSRVRHRFYVSHVMVIECDLNGPSGQDRSNSHPDRIISRSCNRYGVLDPLPSVHPSNTISTFGAGFDIDTLT